MEVHETHLQWIRDLNIRSAILNMGGEKVGNILELIGPGEDTDSTGIKINNNKWDISLN